MAELNKVGRYVTIDGSATDDTIKANVFDASINAGGGNDLISLESDMEYFNVTINGGRGNDTVDCAKFTAVNVVYEYADGDGNDTVTANEDYYSAQSIVRITSGKSSAYVDDWDFVIKVGKGSLTFKDTSPGQIILEENKKFYLYADYGEETLAKLPINSLTSDSLIFNGNSNTVISGAGGKQIFNYGSKVTLNSGTDGGAIDNILGSDVVINANNVDHVHNFGNNVTVNGGSTNAGYLTNHGSNVLIKGSFSNGSDIGITNYGSNVTIQSDENQNHINSYGENVVIAGGGGDDEINLQFWGESTDAMNLQGNKVLIKYSTGDGNDTIYGFNSSDTLAIDGKFSTIANDDNVIVSIGSDSIVLYNAGADDLNIIQYNEADTLKAGIEYNVKKPKVLTVTDPFKGFVNAGNISEKITIIDATGSTKPLVIKAGDNNATAISVGGGEATLSGGAKDDKLYGGKGVNVFAYTVGEGKDGIFNYQAQDIVSIDGAIFDEITLSDKANTLTINFNNDQRSKLTVSKLQANDPVTFDIGGEEIVYGVIPTNATIDKNKSTLIIDDKVSLDADATIQASDIASTLKEINAKEYSGTINIVGNANPNVLRGGKGGSTLYGGHTSKAYNDKFYSGSGADVFVYAAGDGGDVIYNLDGGEGDYVLLKGVDSIDASKDVNVSATKIAVTINKTKLTLENYGGEVKFVNEDGDVLYKTGVNLPSGVKLNNKSGMLTVEEGAELDDDATIDAGEISTLVKEIKVVDYDRPVALVGNKNANVIRAGDGGSTLYGGVGDAKKPSADKLHGSTVAAADVFVYAKGDGADIIYNFDGAQGDYVVVKGLESTDKFDSTTVVWSGNKLIATINKQKLTLEEPKNVVRFVDETGTELYRTGVEFESGVGYNSGKTIVTVDSGASDIDDIDLRDGYAASVKEVNAKDYSGAIHIVGNDQANVLRAGSGGATLDGSYNKTTGKATADKLHGSSSTTKAGADIFIWDASVGGADQIFNYRASEGDLISITGAADTLTIDNANFKISGAKVTMSLGKNSLTFSDLVDSQMINLEYGDGKTFSYASLPSGVGYNGNYKTMTIGGAFSGTFDVTENDYRSTAVTIDASDAPNEITLIGNRKTKAMIGGKGSTTMIGGTINDNFTAGSGADVIVYSDGGGKDVINNFDSSTDVLKIVGNTSSIAATDFVEKGSDITLTVGKGSITFKDAPRGVLKVEYDGGSIDYKTLPLNTTYVAKTSALTLTKFFSDDGLDANDLDVPVKEINASAVASTAVDLQASSENTRMTLGKGGGTLRGGSGADTMIGNAGVDVFVVGEGADVIDKFSFKDDKVVIVGALTDSTLVGSKDVQLTTTNGKVHIKSVLGQEITVVNGGVEQKYKFTKDAKTLEAALVSSGGASEFASDVEDYWFTSDGGANDELGELIGLGSTAEDAALGSLDMSFDPKNLLNVSACAATERSRHLKK